VAAVREEPHGDDSVVDCFEEGNEVVDEEDNCMELDATSLE